MTNMWYLAPHAGNVACFYTISLMPRVFLDVNADNYQQENHGALQYFCLIIFCLFCLRACLAFQTILCTTQKIEKSNLNIYRKSSLVTYI